jgi:hypothetical protein
VTQSSQPARSYGCTFGCGNPYDVVIVQVADGTTEFLCMPCFVKLAADVLAAMTETDNPQVNLALASMGGLGQQSAPGPTGRARGHNAPATASDPDIFAAYDDVMTMEDLPDEFRS